MDNKKKLESQQDKKKNIEIRIVMKKVESKSALMGKSGSNCDQVKASSNDSNNNTSTTPVTKTVKKDSMFRNFFNKSSSSSSSSSDKNNNPTPITAPAQSNSQGYTKVNVDPNTTLNQAGAIHLEEERKKA